MAVVWDDELEALFAADLTVALGYRTPVFRAAGMTDDVEQEMRLSLCDPADPDEVAEYFESRVEPDG